jgi:hypothetical protein
MLASAAPFSVASGDVLLNLFHTNPGDPLVSGYTLHLADITSVLNSHVGTPLRLRFAETDNVFNFQMGVDNVDISLSAVPEPSCLIPLSGALLVVARRRGARRTL